MPFPKIRLKKSKQQYNVASKSAYVISVELLDNTTLECTLTAESTGRDCMDNVCQRLNLQQSDLFGLRYFSRRHTYPKIRWVELERPLKKQLDKYAQEAYLYLGVMFYVNDVSLLEDEVTRYHYFLQLKMDVVDGRLRCNYEQAIVLASYSLQAEFGDHDPEKHTIDYLQDLPLLPKPMITQLTEDRLSALLDAIIGQHASLRGIAQQLAEIYYIVGSQQLDGYGQECFLAKDDRGDEVLIGASLSGIVIRRGNVQSPQFLIWQDITNLVNHKRYFGIECQNFEFSVQFLLEDPDAAKYVWKMCVLQHTFYKMHSSGTESNELNITLEHSGGTHQHHSHHVNHPTNFASHGGSVGPGTSFSDYPEQHFLPPGMLPQSSSRASGTIQRSEIENFHAKQTQRLAPMHYVSGPEAAAGFVLRPSTSSMSIHRRQEEVQNGSRSFSNLSFTQQGPITSARSVNDLDQVVMWPQAPPPLPSNTSRQYDSRLPPYRPAPDYETAIRNKYGSGVLARINQVPQTSHFPQQYQNNALHTSQPTLITDVLTNVYNNNSADMRIGNPDASYHVYNTNLMNANPSSAYSNSTPELNKINQSFHQTQTQLFYPQLNSGSQVINPYSSSNTVEHIQPTQDQIVAELQRLNLYKPPPPYPGRMGGDRQHGAYLQQQQRMMSSTSTPDLAGQFIGGNRQQGSDGLDPKNYPVPQYPVSGFMGGSSPDLVSRRTLGLAAVSKTRPEKMTTHRTVENLNHFSTGDVLRNLNLSDSRMKSAFSSAEFHGAPTEFLQDSGNIESVEPIYQNQAELRQQMLAAGKEPIYQNLPAHERHANIEMIKNEIVHQEASGVTVDLNESSHEIDQLPEKDTEKKEEVNNSTSSENFSGHISRVAITNSRENLSDLRDAADRPKTSVTKINIGLGLRADSPPQSASPSKSPDDATRVENNNEIKESNTPEKTLEVFSQSHSRVDKRNSTGSSTTTSLSKTSSTPWSGSYHHLHRLSQDFSLSHETSPKTPTTKPRGVRRKWGFHFGGSKTGSLKSLKSLKSGSRDRLDNLDSPGPKLGPMMLATLHGLTRSRPDLLAESMETFSAFTTPSRMPKDEIGAYLEAKLAEGEVLREFERIPKKKLSSDVKSMFKSATLAENVIRNRFNDVLPYEENRVRLVGDKENKTGYINASHISATVGNQQRFYIASQGPLPQTVAHFWQMVFQCDVHIIVMLTEVADQEGSNAVPLTTSNCIPYWPQKNGSTLEIGDFRISKQFTSVSETGCYTTSTLHMLHLPTKRSRTLWHLHYTDWGDHGCPMNTKSYLEFLEEINSLRQHTSTTPSRLLASSPQKSPKPSELRSRNPPVLVHCSAGVGRTGVAILCDILLYCVDHNIDVDIPKILTHLRQQRMLMVQTVAQYKFVHTAIIQYLKQSRLI